MDKQHLQRLLHAARSIAELARTSPGLAMNLTSRQPVLGRMMEELVYAADAIPYQPWEVTASCCPYCGTKEIMEDISEPRRNMPGENPNPGPDPADNVRQLAMYRCTGVCAGRSFWA